jgi:hypothetical protein
MRVTRIALTVAFVLMPPVLSVHAAETSLITLVCDGYTTTTATDKDAKSEPNTGPISRFGMVVNLAERTVSFVGYLTPIAAMDAGSGSFSGENKVLAPPGAKSETMFLSGSIDRVTGSAKVVAVGAVSMVAYELRCRLTNRLF